MCPGNFFFIGIRQEKWNNWVKLNYSESILSVGVEKRMDQRKITKNILEYAFLDRILFQRVTQT